MSINFANFLFLFLFYTFIHVCSPTLSINLAENYHHVMLHHKL